MRYRYRMLSCLLIICMISSLIPSVSAQQHKLVALTFDDGPGPYTERLLDGLAERGVRATFFCLGNRADQYPDLIRRMVAEGHQVANHSYSHPNLNELTVESARYQIERTDQIINRITGGEESYHIRPPYGNSSQTLRNNLSAPVIIWSVDTLDWKFLNSTAVKNQILSDVFDGSIVLMHDIHPTTIDGILAALDTLEARGYEFVTVKELIRRRGLVPVSGQCFYRCDSNGKDLPRLQPPEMRVSGTAEELEIILTSPGDAPIYYTTDGSDITYSSNVYEGVFKVQLPCTIKAVAAWDLNGDRSDVVVQTYELPPAGEPHVGVEKGSVCFVPAGGEETVFVKTEDSVHYLPSDEVVIEADTWFSYYADADGYTPSAVRTLLFTSEKNLTSDIRRSDWFYPSMDHCISSGYYKGNGNWKFDPSGILTRAMFIELLYRYDGADATGVLSPFLDVTEASYYYRAAAWGYSSGIISGTGDGPVFTGSTCHTPRNGQNDFPIPEIGYGGVGCGLSGYF